MAIKAKDLVVLGIFIIFTQAAGIIGALFTTPSIDAWYVYLMKPELAPPNWIFAPVWTALYLLMAIAAFLVWRYGWSRKDVRYALAFYGLQLVLNTFWSIIFFGWRSPGLALIEIAFLWTAIMGTIIAFARVSKSAAWLLIPYIIWVSFALYLNAMIWVLN